MYAHNFLVMCNLCERLPHFYLLSKMKVISGATVTVVALHASFFDAEALPQSEDPEQFPMIEQV